MKNEIVLITSSFPYGNGETFLETEIEYLCAKFEKVSIVPTTKTNGKSRKLPANCGVIPFEINLSLFDKINGIFAINNKVVRNELKIIKSTYNLKLNLNIYKTLLVSFIRGNKIANFLIEKWKNNIENTIFYSYWCEDTALGIGLAKLKYKNLKGVSRIHGWDVYFNVHPNQYLPFRHFIYEQLTKIYSISQKGKTAVMDQWKLKENYKINVSKLGVKPSIKLERDTVDNEIRIVSCSSVISLKRVKLIAEAVKTIENNQISWHHFGDGPLFEDLKNFTTNTPKNVKINLVGRIPNAEIYTYYESIKPHIFINVSTSEGIPVSIMEAISFGIACIATNVGGNSEIVNNENGYLLSENPEPKEISKAILQVFQSINAKSENAFYVWNKDYNSINNYTKFVSELNSI